MIKAVLFDVDGVLIDSFEANFRYFSDLMQKFGYDSPKREQFPALFHRTTWDIIKILTESQDEEELEKIFKAAKNIEVPYCTELLTIPEYLKETLEKLSKTYDLGIVSGRLSEHVFLAPQLKRLKNIFKISVGYEDTDNHKPHPDPLILAAQKLGVSPGECVYIGDVENDILAAKAAGMKSIIYAEDILADADASTTEFSRLPEIISKL